VDPRAGLGDMEKRKFLPPSGLELRPLGRPARSYKPSDTMLKGAKASLISYNGHLLTTEI
jgi:hypothetical protein